MPDGQRCADRSVDRCHGFPAQRNAAAGKRGKGPGRPGRDRKTELRIGGTHPGAHPRTGAVPGYCGEVGCRQDPASGKCKSRIEDTAERDIGLFPDDEWAGARPSADRTIPGILSRYPFQCGVSAGADRQSAADVGPGNKGGPGGYRTDIPARPVRQDGDHADRHGGQGRGGPVLPRAPEYPARAGIHAGADAGIAESGIKCPALHGSGWVAYHHGRDGTRPACRHQGARYRPWHVAGSAR